MKNKKIKIKVEEYLEVAPEEVYLSKVVKSGTGAVINSYKKYIGKEVVVIMANKIRKKIRKEEEMPRQTLEEEMESASDEGWVKTNKNE